MALHVVVDTDAGYDDLLAILYMLADQGNFVIDAITTVGGLCTDPVLGGSVIRSLLEQAGRPEVPVYSGTASAPSGGNPAPAEWTNQVQHLNWPQPVHGPQPGAVSFLQSYMQNADPQQCMVMALGPMTNIAAALAGVTRPGPFVFLAMGGSFGNPPVGSGIPNAPNSEFNMYIDPPSARAVFSSSFLHQGLLPLNATNLVPITRQFIADFATLPANPYVALANQVFQGVLQDNAAMVDSGNYFAWDPLTPVLWDGGVLPDTWPRGAITFDSLGVTTLQSAGSPATSVFMTVNADQFAPAFFGVFSNGHPGALPCGARRLNSLPRFA